MSILKMQRLYVRLHCLVSLSFVIETIYVHNKLVILEATTTASNTHTSVHTNSFSESTGGSGTVRCVGAGAHRAST